MKNKSSQKEKISSTKKCWKNRRKLERKVRIPRMSNFKLFGGEDIKINNFVISSLYEMDCFIQTVKVWDVGSD